MREQHRYGAAFAVHLSITVGEKRVRITWHRRYAERNPPLSLDQFAKGNRRFEMANHILLAVKSVDDERYRTYCRLEIVKLHGKLGSAQGKFDIFGMEDVAGIAGRFLSTKGTKAAAPMPMKAEGIQQPIDVIGCRHDS